jgi:hypothetical protein
LARKNAIMQNAKKKLKFFQNKFEKHKPQNSQSQQSNNMTYIAMAIDAIKALKERGGSSSPAIKKYIIANNATLNFAQHNLRLALKKGVVDGLFVQVKSSYKLSDKAKAAPKKKAVVKKKAAPKEKASSPKKKTAPKKKAAPKEKSAPKKKAVVKKKTAPKEKAAPKKKTAPKKNATAKEKAAPKKKTASKKE